MLEIYVDGLNSVDIITCKIHYPYDVITCRCHYPYHVIRCISLIVDAISSEDVIIVIITSGVFITILEPCPLN